MSSFLQLNWWILVFWTRNYSLVPTYWACSQCSAYAVILCCICQWRKLRFLIYFHLYELGSRHSENFFLSSFPPAVLSPPTFFTVSSFIKITSELLEQPYFIRISQKRMSQTIWFYFVKFIFYLLSSVQIWAHLVQFIFNITQMLAQALILVTVVKIWGHANGALPRPY